MLTRTDMNEDSKPKPVKLVVEYSMTTASSRALAFGLRAVVTQAEGIPPEVFVMHRIPRLMATGFPWDMEIVDEFQNVAAPVDIEETPTEAEATDDTRHFRSSRVELLFRCEADMERARAGIDEDLSALVRSWRIVGAPDYENKETKEYSNG